MRGTEQVTPVFANPTVAAVAKLAEPGSASIQILNPAPKAGVIRKAAVSGVCPSVNLSVGFNQL